MITYRVTMDVDVPDHWTNAMVQDEISDALDEGMTDEVSEFRIRYVIAPQAACLGRWRDRSNLK